MMDIPANFSRHNIPPVLINRQCFPKKVIEGCVKDIIQRRCGKPTAELAVRHIFFNIV